MFSGERLLIAASTAQRARELCRDVQAFGAQPLGPLSTTHEILDALKDAPLDGAILDTYLLDGSTVAAALLLRERLIPFILLKTSDLTSELAALHPPVKAVWAWTPTFHVIRELEAEMGSRCR